MYIIPNKYSKYFYTQLPEWKKNQQTQIYTGPFLKIVTIVTKL